MPRMFDSLRALATSIAASLCAFEQSAYSEPMAFQLQTTEPLCPECTIVFAVGTVEPTSASELRAFLEQHSVPAGSLIDLSSPGGSLAGGVDLGRTIRSAGLRTSIGMRGTSSEQMCASACAYAFLGGVSRIVHPNSSFGIHKFYGKIQSPDAVETTQEIVAALLGYVSSMGVSSELIEIASSTASNDMTWLDASQRMNLRVTTEQFEEGGSVWRTDSKIMSGWQVQADGRIVHFQFGCPQSPISRREELEIREKLSNGPSSDPGLNQMLRKWDLDKLRRSEEFRLDISYFEHRETAIDLQCSLSTASGGYQCGVSGSLGTSVPLDFTADLPWTKFSGYHFDFYGMSRTESNTVRLRTEIAKADLRDFFEQNATNATYRITVEPDVIFVDGEVIDQLASDDTELRLPRTGFAEAGKQLFRQCDLSRP
jgi:hypothetical protein